MQLCLSTWTNAGTYCIRWQPGSNSGDTRTVLGRVTQTSKSLSNASEYLSSCCWTVPGILTICCCLFHMFHVGGSVSPDDKTHFSPLLLVTCITPLLITRGVLKWLVTSKELRTCRGCSTWRCSQRLCSWGVLLPAKQHRTAPRSLRCIYGMQRCLIFVLTSNCCLSMRYLRLVMNVKQSFYVSITEM